MDARMALLLPGSIVFAALMGFAIQRGATCTVAAVDEVVNQRRAQRLGSLAEAALWVGLGALLLRHAGWQVPLPMGHEAGWRTVLGGVLLGGGAYVNRACVFGAIARWSNGEWAYVATPLGFFVGCWLFLRVLASMAAPVSPQMAPALALPGWAVVLLVVVLVVRVSVGGLRAWSRTSCETRTRSIFQRARHMAAALWRPAPATIVIGLSFLAMMLMAGPWAYTELLSEWAAGMARETWMRALLAAALFGGAALGGWRAGKWTWHLRGRVPASLWLRCLLGGAFMGLGSLLIPGGNDGLILVGMPLLWPYAWLAFGSMCLTIAGLMACQKLTQ